MCKNGFGKVNVDNAADGALKLMAAAAAAPKPPCAPLFALEAMPPHLGGSVIIPPVSPVRVCACSKSPTAVGGCTGRRLGKVVRLRVGGETNGISCAKIGSGVR